MPARLRSCCASRGRLLTAGSKPSGVASAPWPVPHHAQYITKDSTPSSSESERDDAVPGFVETKSPRSAQNQMSPRTNPGGTLTRFLGGRGLAKKSP